MSGRKDFREFKVANQGLVVCTDGSEGWTGGGGTGIEGAGSGGGGAGSGGRGGGKRG